MAYFINQDCAIVRKHYIVILLRKIRFLIFFAVSSLLFYISFYYREVLWEEFVFFVFFPLIFGLLNYSFFKMMLSYIDYYYNLFIIYENHIIIIKSSLILIDDLEVLDVNKVMKIDSISRWLFSNMLWFWNILLEQQKNDVRTFHFMPNPYRIVEIFKKHRQEFKD